jgi:hypothetical protein
MSSICWRDSEMLGMGGCGAMSHPLIHAGLSLFVLATSENGGALSVAAFAASVA